MDSNHDSDIVVIGGGVIGLCAAYYLARQGQHVTLLEKGAIGDGASYGNAGLIVPSHAIPLAAPGVLSRGLKWLLDGESPFYIKPTLDRGLLAWLWRFRAAARQAPMRRGLAVLRDLSFASLSLYNELISSEGLHCHYEHAGLMGLYRTAAGLDHAVREADLLQEFGIPLEILNEAEARRYEPALAQDTAGAVHFLADAHLEPALLVQELARCLTQMGVEIRTGHEVLEMETGGGRIKAIRTNKGELRPAQVVLAAGAWSPLLAAGLPLALPVQPAKGYSITVRRPSLAPQRPLMLGEARVAVTPMGPNLRFAGTLELAGFDMRINRRRVDAIMRAGRLYLNGLAQLELVEIWRGLRPCTADGLPIIGRTAALPNLIMATGHGVLGVSLGAATGRLVAQVAAGETPDIDLTPLRLER